VVIPLVSGGELVGVLDVDSPLPARFTAAEYVLSPLSQVPLWEAVARDSPLQDSSF